MELSKNQINYIKEYITDEGITIPDLAENILDHICCAIEYENSSDFSQTFNETIKKFGEEGLLNIEKETKRVLINKKENTMKRNMFIIGYIASILSTTGLLFKLQHWPFAGILLVTGIALLNFAFLPMYFYNRYKLSIQN